MNKYTFWVSQEKLVDEANIIHKNSCMTESEIEELERNLAENDTCKEKERSADDAGKNLGVLYKIKTHSITKANKLFYAGAIVNTDRQQRERQQREKNQ